MKALSKQEDISLKQALTKTFKHLTLVSPGEQVIETATGIEYIVNDIQIIARKMRTGLGFTFTYSLGKLHSGFGDYRYIKPQVLVKQFEKVNTDGI